MKLDQLKNIENIKNKLKFVYVTLCHDVIFQDKKYCFLVYAYSPEEANEIVTGSKKIFRDPESTPALDYIGDNLKYYTDELRHIIPFAKKYRMVRWTEGLNMPYARDEKKREKSKQTKKL